MLRGDSTYCLCSTGLRGTYRESLSVVTKTGVSGTPTQPLLRYQSGEEKWERAGEKLVSEAQTREGRDRGQDQLQVPREKWDGKRRLITATGGSQGRRVTGRLTNGRPDPDKD